MASRTDPAPLTEEQRTRLIRDIARQRWEDEGQIEIDDNAIVSIVDGDEPVHGAYVAAWVWVDLDEEADDDE